MLVVHTLNLTPFYGPTAETNGLGERRSLFLITVFEIRRWTSCVWCTECV